MLELTGPTATNRVTAAHSQELSLMHRLLAVFVYTLKVCWPLFLGRTRRNITSSRCIAHVELSHDPMGKSCAYTDEIMT